MRHMLQQTRSASESPGPGLAQRKGAYSVARVSSTEEVHYVHHGLNGRAMREDDSNINDGGTSSPRHAQIRFACTLLSMAQVRGLSRGGTTSRLETYTHRDGLLRARVPSRAAACPHLVG